MKAERKKSGNHKTFADMCVTRREIFYSEGRPKIVDGKNLNFCHFQGQITYIFCMSSDFLVRVGKSIKIQNHETFKKKIAATI